MSGNDGGGDSSMPFGFTFVGHDERQHQNQDESHPPSGPPLLDNNETGLLRDFFDNPNNIDPGFLAIAQGRQHEHDPYTSSAQQQWFIPQDPPAQSTNNSHQTSPVQPYGHHHVASNDVYAAARLLHSNQYTNGGIAPQTFPGATHAPQAPMYSYPQSAFAGIGLGDEHISPNTDRSIYPELDSRGRPLPASRPAPLNFGSDSKFRGSKYAAPNITKAPDQELVNLVSSFSHDDASPQQGRQSHPYHDTRPSQPRRKRRRVSEEEEDSDSSQEDIRHKRARARIRSEDDGSDEDDIGSGGRLFGRSSKSKAQPSPGHRRRSSPSSKKAARENLSEEQKRSNHIQSEQKRRNLIKVGFEDTNRMVPDLRAGGFSKSNMLQEAARFMRELKEGNNRLAAMLGMIDKG